MLVCVGNVVDQRHDVHFLGMTRPDADTLGGFPEISREYCPCPRMVLHTLVAFFGDGNERSATADDSAALDDTWSMDTAIC